MRSLARTDANHAAIVDLLRAAGCRVQSLHQVGGGVPDLLCYYPAGGAMFLVEVKTPTGKLTPAQVAWHAEWDGAPVYVVASDDDVLRMLDALRG